VSHCDGVHCCQHESENLRTVVRNGVLRILCVECRSEWDEANAPDISPTSGTSPNAGGGPL
jgi:hypothetical protein